MIGLTCLELYNSDFKKNTTNKNFQLYTDTFDKFSIEDSKDELGEIYTISDITSSHLRHEIIGPRIIQAYKKLVLEKSSTDGYILILMGYARFPFRAFETYFRIAFGLDEDDIQLILKQHKSNFVTHEIPASV